MPLLDYFVDPVAYIPTVCECHNCGAEIYEGNSIVQDADGNSFCEESCIITHFYENGVIQSATAE